MCFSGLDSLPQEISICYDHSEDFAALCTTSSRQMKAKSLVFAFCRLPRELKGFGMSFYECL